MMLLNLNTNQLELFSCMVLKAWLLSLGFYFFVIRDLGTFLQALLISSFKSVSVFLTLAKDFPK